MHNITLFCTRHGEAGYCNIHGLYNIMIQLNPEVIFEEIPPCLFDECYNNINKYKLETNAIKLYLADHDVKHIPVDYDTIMPQSFWDENKFMFEQVEKNNSEFCKWCDYDSQYVRQYGFNYLNSNYNNNIHREKDKEMEATLKLLNNEKLLEIFETWNNINDKRENTMIENIYNYSKNNTFDRGLFFIGSAHREAIITKIKKYKETEELNIVWNYPEYDNNSVQTIYI